MVVAKYIRRVVRVSKPLSVHEVVMMKPQSRGGGSPRNMERCWLIQPIMGAIRFEALQHVRINKM